MNIEYRLTNDEVKKFKSLNSLYSVSSPGSLS